MADGEESSDEVPRSATEDEQGNPSRTTSSAEDGYEVGAEASVSDKSALSEEPLTSQEAVGSEEQAGASNEPTVSKVEENKREFVEYERKKNNPLLYSFFFDHRLEWPPLLLSGCPIAGASPERLLCAEGPLRSLVTHTHNPYPNYLITAQVLIPHDPAKDHSNFKLQLTQQIYHEKFIMHAACLESPSIVATHTVK